MGLRAFMVRHFGKPVEPHSFTEGDWPAVPKRLRTDGFSASASEYLLCAAGDPAAFSESTITKQPEFHPVRGKR